MRLVFLLKTIFLIALYAGCSRYAPLTSTKIKLSGISALTTGNTKIIFSGLSSNGDYFSRTLSSEKVDDIELKQGRWTFYGIRVSDTPGETLCGYTQVDLMAERQDVIVPYNKSNCSNSKFGDKERYNEDNKQLNPAKIYLCSSIDGAQTDCGTETPFDGKSISFTIFDSKLSTTNSPSLKSTGFSIGCVDIDSRTGLVQTDDLFTIPIGNDDSLPFHTKVTMYKNENCQGDEISLQSTQLLHFYQSSYESSNHYSDYSYYFYEVDLFNAENASNLLAKGESCEKSEQCASSKCYLEQGFDRQAELTTVPVCYGLAAGETCESDDECQSNKCIDNGGEFGCAKVSSASPSPSCLNDEDCISGICDQALTMPDTDFTGGICQSMSTLLTDEAMSFAASDEITTELGTDPAVAGTMDFSISTWIKTDSVSPSIIYNQRDKNSFVGVFNLGINGAAPGQNGFRQGDDPLEAEKNMINFSFYQNETAKIHLFATPAQNFLDKKWHQIIATRKTDNGNTILKIYLDGNLVAEDEFAVTISLDNTIESYIGGNFRDNGHFFNGAINQTTVWNKVLSESEVDAIFKLGMNPSLTQDFIYSNMIISDIPFSNFIDNKGIWELDLIKPPTNKTKSFSNTHIDSHPFFALDDEYNMAGCNQDSDCAFLSNNSICNAFDYVCVLPKNEQCQTNEECLSQRCENNLCLVGKSGDICVTGADCESNICMAESGNMAIRDVCHNTPLSSLLESNGVNYGTSSMLAYFTVGITVGEKISFYKDSKCSGVKLGEQILDGSFSYNLTLSGFSKGENKIFITYTNDEGEISDCTYSKYDFYHVDPNYDFKQAYLDGDVNISTKLSSKRSSGEFSANKAIDGKPLTDSSSVASTANNSTTTPEYWEFEFDDTERLIGSLTFHSASNMAKRFRDLDLIIYDEHDNSVYQYSSVAGGLFKEDTDSEEHTWTINFLGNSLTTGGFNGFVLAKKIRLTRTPATKNISGYTKDDKVQINLAEVDIYGPGPISPNAFILPPTSITLDTQKTSTNESYFFDITGNFPNGFTTIFSDDQCLDSLGMSETTSDQSSISIEANQFNIDTASPGEVNIYAQIVDDNFNYSQCSSLINISSQFYFGLNQHVNCTADTDCTSYHPIAICTASGQKCALPGGVKSSTASWCASGTTTAGVCDEAIDTAVSSITMQNSVTKGIGKAIISMEMSNATGLTVTIYSDSECQTSVGTQALDGSLNYHVLLSNISEGAHTFHHKFTTGAGATDCIETQAAYTVLGETNLKDAYLNETFDMTANQSSTHNSMTADKAIDQYGASTDFDTPNTPISVSHTGLDDESPYWEVVFDNEELPITHLKFYSRVSGDSIEKRFRDLDIIILNSSDQIVYQYSDIASGLFKEHGANANDSDQDNATFSVDFIQLDLAKGEMGIPILGKKIQLHRSLASQNTSEIEEDNHVLTLQDIDIKSLDIDNLHGFVLPPSSISLDIDQTLVNTAYTFDVTGNFDNHTIYIHADPHCTDDPIGSANNVTGISTEIVANNLAPGNYTSGLLYFYAIAEDSTNNKSACSRVYNIDESLMFGLDNMAECTSNSDCTLGHPSALCVAGACMLREDAETPEQSWCMSGSATNKKCDPNGLDSWCLDDSDCPGTATCNPQNKCTGGGGGGGGG